MMCVIFRVCFEGLEFLEAIQAKESNASLDSKRFRLSIRCIQTGKLPELLSFLSCMHFVF